MGCVSVCVHVSICMYFNQCKLVRLSLTMCVLSIVIPYIRGNLICMTCPHGGGRIHTVLHKTGWCVRVGVCESKGRKNRARNKNNIFV